MKRGLEDIIDSCSLEELIRGYIYDEEERMFKCIFCDEFFYEDKIYISKTSKSLINSRGAIIEHMEVDHGGVFNYLINLDKSLTGLTDRQKEIIEVLFLEDDNLKASKIVGTTPATIRSYKYKNRERARQSKIFLAITYLNDIKDRDKPNDLPKKLISDEEENLKLINNILENKNLDFKIGDD